MQILILLDHIERILSRYKTIIFLIISMFIVEALISIKAEISDIGSATSVIESSTNSLTNDISSIKQEVKAIESNTTDIKINTNQY